jgi:hypothetical protein
LNEEDTDRRRDRRWGDRMIEGQREKERGRHIEIKRQISGRIWDREYYRHRYRELLRQGDRDIGRERA